MWMYNKIGDEYLFYNEKAETIWAQKFEHIFFKRGVLIKLYCPLFVALIMNEYSDYEGEM